MYFRQLHQRNKFAFWLLLGACLIQLVIFYKQGAVLSPFYNYGMYSEKISPEEDYEVINIYVDGQLLKGKDFGSHEWDRLYVPLQMYLAKDSINEDMIDIKNRLLAKLHLSYLESYNAPFRSNVPAADFQDWYKKLVEKLIRTDAHNINIYKCKYKWNGSQLNISDSTMLMSISS